MNSQLHRIFDYYYANISNAERSMWYGDKSFFQIFVYNFLFSPMDRWKLFTINEKSFVWALFRVKNRHIGRRQRRCHWRWIKFNFYLDQYIHIEWGFCTYQKPNINDIIFDIWYKRNASTSTPVSDLQLHTLLFCGSNVNRNLYELLMFMVR